MSNSLLPETLAWLRQTRDDGFQPSLAILHLLERVEVLEAAQQQPHQDKLDRLIALDRGDDEPTPEAAPVATLSDALISAEAVRVMIACSLKLKLMMDAALKLGNGRSDRMGTGH
jgi:hypothetical protein